MSVFRQRELTMAVTLTQLLKQQLSISAAAIKLGRSTRTIYRLKKKYLELGDKCLMYQNRGRPSNRKTSDKVWREVRTLLDGDFKDFGPTFAAEKLSQLHNIHLSRETLRLWMGKNGYWKGKRKRRTFRQRRARKNYYGQMIQIDGSYHDWFEGRAEEACLIAFIDDATSKLMWLEFVPHETTAAYMRATKEYVSRYGRPVSLHSDRHSIFQNNTYNRDHERPRTQFERALSEIDVQLICANSPEAKGRVERSFKTLQDRLIKEMRLQNISSVPQANIFLKDQYIPEHNARYAQDPLLPEDVHRAANGYDLDTIMSELVTCSVQRDYIVQHDNKLYQLHKEQPVTIRPRSKVELRKHLSGDITIHARGALLSFSPILQRPKQKQEPKKHTFWAPAKNHPWRKSYKQESDKITLLNL